MSGDVYKGKSKIRTLLGDRVLDDLRGKTVVRHPLVLQHRQFHLRQPLLLANHFHFPDLPVLDLQL